jgi:hypothetical protein
MSLYNILAVDPEPGREAEVKAIMLVAPMAGMLLMVPSYILATLGSLFRSFSADPKVSIGGREYSQRNPPIPSD